MSSERVSFGSRIGFILVSAGCAVGIGNVWKFPYMAGSNGGAVFVLFYLLFLIILGIPVLSMELAVGRAGRKSAVGAYKALEKPGSFWHLHGWLCYLGNFILMMYYTTVSGWMLSYMVKFATGRFSGISGEEVAGVFTDMLGNPLEMGSFMAVTVLAGFGICALGVRNGLEKVSTIMMAGLIMLILILGVNSLLLPKAAEGLRFYLFPDFGRAMEAGLDRVITGAMNQAFFTLSLGIGSMEIFGSYMSKDNTLLGEAARITALDTFVALMAGLIIFPACFSFGVEPDQGPSLIFITLPRIFLDMFGGQLWGSLFFLFMTFASFSTVTAVFENLIAALMDNLGWSRKKSVLVNLVAVLILSLPCVFGYNLLSGMTFIGGRDVLDSEDFLVSNLLLPGGSLIFLLFCVTRFGWGFKHYQEETNTGKGIRLPSGIKPVFQFVLPILILIILIGGLIPQ